ncbi:TauD/TfdA family dioxygenase [Variovorax paradoxus]|nr:TauD/TfdA family dioxygenase [Variovorax paradoxus]MBT2304815.1 TauD/TfdA family dioxygenase [Variovorax paradoxus]
MEAVIESKSSPQTDHIPWDVERLSPAAGAEVRGLHLGQKLTDGQIARLRAQLVEHKVLVFRKQDITPAEHVAFARRFGQLEVHPILNRHPEFEELVTFESNGDRKGGENVFHSDTTFQEAPSMGSILRCVNLPPIGGDTIWVNMAQVYEDLPDSTKRKLEGLNAWHDASQAFGWRARTPEDRRKMRETAPPVEHPVVCTHPESGEKILFVNDAFTSHFSNFKELNGGSWAQDGAAQARELLNALLRQIRIPEYHFRLRWEKDTVVFWDNRSTQHYAVSDYYPNVRSMMRATVNGTKPV